MSRMTATPRSVDAGYRDRVGPDERGDAYDLNNLIAEYVGTQPFR